MFKRLKSNKVLLFVSLAVSLLAVFTASLATLAWYQGTEVKNTAQTINVSTGSSDLNITGVTGYKYEYDDIGGSIDYSHGDVISYTSKGDAVNASQGTVDTALDPVSEGIGYYIKGDDTWASDLGGTVTLPYTPKEAWTFASALKLMDRYGTSDGGSGYNWAAYMGLHFVVDEEIKIWHHYYNAGNAVNKAITSFASEGCTSGYEPSLTRPYENIKINQNGIYNVWVKKDGSGNESVYFQRTADYTPALSSKNINGNGPKRSSSTSPSTGIRIVGVDDSGFTWYAGENNKADLKLRIWGITFSSDCYYSSDTFSSIPNDAFTMVNGTYSARDNDKKTFDITMKYDQDNYGIDGRNCRAYSYILPWFITGCSFKFYNTAGKWTADNPSTDKSASARANDYRYRIYGDYNSKSVDELTNHEGTFSYSITTYSMTVNNNSGSGATSQNGVKKYGKYTQPSNPTRANHRFTGWTITSGGAGTPTFPMCVTADITITAQWIEISDLYYNLYVYQYKVDPLTNGYTLSATYVGSKTYSDSTYTTVSPLGASTDPSTLSISGYTASKNTWCGTWYENYSAGSFTNAYSGTAHTKNSYKNLYTYVTEKVTYLTLKKYYDKQYDGASDAVANYTGTYNSTALSSTFRWGMDTKIDFATNPNLFGANFHTSPETYSGIKYTHKGTYHTATGVGKTDAFTNGTGWSPTEGNEQNPVTIYSQYSETSQTITFKKAYIRGNASVKTAASVGTYSGSKAYISWPTFNWTTEAPDNATIKDATDYLNETGEFTIFTRADSYWYTDALCTSKYNGGVALTTDPDHNTLYCKMMDIAEVDDGVSKTQIYIDYASGVNEYLHKIEIRNPSGNYGSSEISDNRMGGSGPANCNLAELATPYNSTGNLYYWTYKIYTGSTFIIHDGNWSSGDDKHQTTDVTWPSGDYAGATTLKIETSTTYQDGGHKYNWFWHKDDNTIYPGTAGSNGYYLVGNGSFTTNNGGNSANQWTFAGGILMNSSIPSPDITAYKTNVKLTAGMSFQVYQYNSANTVKKLGCTALSGSPTTDYCNVSNGVFTVKNNVDGYYDIQLCGNQIIIEDTNPNSVIFFTSNVVCGGVAGQRFIMHKADGNNVAAFEEGIKVHAGDEFAIRQKWQGYYVWKGASDISSHSSEELETGTSATLGDNIDGSYTGSIENVTTMRFKQDGIYTFYIGTDGKIYVASINDNGYGYYIHNNPTEQTSGFVISGDPKMKTIASGVNKATYMRYKVMDEDGEYLTFIKRTKTYNPSDKSETDENQTIYYIHKNNQEGYNASQQNGHMQQDCYNDIYRTDGVMKFDKGIYNFYITYDNNNKHYYVSYTNVTNAEYDFYNLNEVPTSANTNEKMYNANTSMVIQIDYTTTSTTAMDVKLDVVMAATGLSTHVRYAFTTNDSYSYSTTAVYGQVRQWAYNDFETTNFSSRSTEGTLTLSGGTLTAGSAVTHHAYIIVDYIPKNDYSGITSSLGKDFKFVLKIVQ